MSKWSTTVGIRMVGLREKVSRQIILELATMTQHCKGQHYPKVRFPENGYGQGLGTQVKRWVQ